MPNSVPAGSSLWYTIWHPTVHSIVRHEMYIAGMAAIDVGSSSYKLEDYVYMQSGTENDNCTAYNVVDDMSPLSHSLGDYGENCVFWHGWKPMYFGDKRCSKNSIGRFCQFNAGMLPT